MNFTDLVFDVTDLQMAIFGSSKSIQASIRLDEIEVLNEVFLAVDDRLKLDFIVTDANFNEEDQALCSTSCDSLYFSGYEVKAVRSEVDPSFVIVDDEAWIIEFPIRARLAKRGTERDWCADTFNYLKSLDSVQIPIFRDVGFAQSEHESTAEYTGRILRFEREFVNPKRQEITQAIVKSSNDLLSMSPRAFEEFIAHLLDKLGMDTQLTPFTRDGGRDILARPRNSPVPLLLLVECKRYSPQHVVGVDRVRSLYGVVESERAGAGLLVTTSRFSKDAITLAAKLAPRMSLRDFDGITKWVQAS